MSTLFLTFFYPWGGQLQNHVKIIILNSFYAPNMALLHTFFCSVLSHSYKHHLAIASATKQAPKLPSSQHRKQVPYLPMVSLGNRYPCSSKCYMSTSQLNVNLFLYTYIYQKYSIYKHYRSVIKLKLTSCTS